jgi:hypothetical protein
MLQILTVSSNVAASRRHPPARTNGATSTATLTANVGTLEPERECDFLSAAPRHLVLRRHRPLVPRVCVGPVPRKDWEESPFHADYYLSQKTDEAEYSIRHRYPESRGGRVRDHEPHAKR